MSEIQLFFGELSSPENNISYNSVPLAYNSKQPLNFQPDYLNLFEFEKFTGNEEWRQWISKNWSWSVYCSAIYLMGVFYGQIWMRNRKPFKLRGLLTLWNVALAGFSIAGFVRSFPEVWVAALKPNGFHRSVCFLENHNGATSLWSLLFTMSKIVEFGDTAFIILRKQPLIFLHWYHHITVCIFCWYQHSSYDPSSRWFSTMNLLIHSLMYSYYAMRSLEIKVPRGYAMFLTCLQITQMVLGVVINVHSYLVIANGEECNRPVLNIYMSFGIYFSYFVLFANFFYKNYMRSGSKKDFVKKIN